MASHRVIAWLVLIALAGATTPAVAQDKCKPLRDNMDVFMDLALVNTEFEGKANLKFKFESLKSFGLEAGGGGAKFIGAARSLADEIEALQNDKIREELRPVKNALLACIQSAIDEQSNAAPNPLTLKFTLRFKDPKAVFHHADNVVVGVKRPPREISELPARQNQNWLFDIIAMPRPKERVDVYLVRQVSESHAASTPSGVEFCLTRKSPLPPSGAGYTALRCEEGKSGHPCQFDISDPGWVDFCPASSTWVPWNFSLIGSAQAAVQPVRVWSAPSLLTLKRNDPRADVMGFTEFEIVSSDLKGLNADSYSVALWANGAEVRINGLPAEMAPLAYNPAKDFSYAFGLQNLNFTGERGGCDQLRAEITFYRDGEPIGEPFTLTRSYVALRDAETATITAQNRKFVWRGTYRRPPNEFDHEVFVSSVIFGPDNRANKSIEAGREAAGRLQRIINGMGFTFEGKSVVGIVRPPLTQNSFGIALGVQEASKQIRFTFTKASAERLRREVLAFRGRAAERSPIRQAVVPSTFVYPVNKADAKAPDGICPV